MADCAASLSQHVQMQLGSIVAQPGQVPKAADLPEGQGDMLCFPLGPAGASIFLPPPSASKTSQLTQTLTTFP